MDLQTDIVWCDNCGCIHDKTSDPFGYGEDICGEKDWRKVWVGALFVPVKK